MQRGATLLAHWAFLALASAVREENALMSYGFLFPQKPAMVSAVMSVDIGRLFLFASLA